MEKKTNLRNSMSSMFGSSEMKRSESEIAIDELFASEDCKKLFHQKDDFLQAASQALFPSSSTSENISHHLLPFSFKNSEFQKGLAMSAADNPFSKTRKHCSSLAPIDSQTSICVSSPISVNNSKGSSHEQSDDDELELEFEAGPCEESTDPCDVKRIRRMVSNRESARRSRRRKQAHLTDLEQQVELLRGENDALFKQLAEATQQFKDSTTNNRVLRSDVEALRAKVKLAEDMVARGSLTSSLSHLLTNYLNTSHSYMNSNNSSVNHIDHNVSPIVPPHADNNASFPIVPEQNIGLENANAFDSNALNGAMPEMWNWESHDIAPGSK